MQPGKIKDILEFPNTYHVDRELDLVDEVVLPLLDGGHAALDVPQQRRHLALLSAASETLTKVA